MRHPSPTLIRTYSTIPKTTARDRNASSMRLGAFSKSRYRDDINQKSHESYFVGKGMLFSASCILRFATRAGNVRDPIFFISSSRRIILGMLLGKTTRADSKHLMKCSDI